MKLLKSRKFWDALLAVLFVAAGSYLVYRLYAFRFLPDKYLYMIILILVLLALIFILMIFAKVKEWIQWIKRVLIVLLCIGLTFAAVTIGNVESSTRKITAAETIGYTNIHVVVRNDSGIDAIADLSDKKVLIQDGNDKEYGEYVKKKITASKKAKDVTFEEKLDYSTMISDLLNEKCDAIVITDAAYQTLGQSIAAVKSDTGIIQTYKKKKTITANGSEKDIRYETLTIFITGNEGTGDINTDNNSDVNMLLIVNPLAAHVEMISIPRDSFVPNPALGNRNDKLTHTGSSGSENTVTAIEQLFGIDVDFYLKLNFSSVIEIVDALDGIDIDIPLDFCEQDENRSFAQEDLICLSKGEQRIDGREALAYARHRHSYVDQDLSRNQAQQRVFQAIVKRMLHIGNVGKIEKLMDIATRLCATNMPIEQVTNFISYQLDHPQEWTFSSISLNNGYSDMLATASMGSALPLSVYLLNKDDIQAVIDRYQELCELMNFSTFAFDLNNLEKDRVYVSSDYNFLWAGDNTSQWEAVVNEETILPDTPTQTPSEPSEPTTPTQPSEPSTGGNEETTTPSDPDGGNTETDPSTPDTSQTVQP